MNYMSKAINVTWDNLGELGAIPMVVEAQFQIITFVKTLCNFSHDTYAQISLTSLMQLTITNHKEC